MKYAWIAAALLWAMPVQAQTISLSSPIACKVGTDCFIQNYVDQDTTSAHGDYACGSLSYDKHTGTDFRLKNLAEMKKGVAVIAAADGTVRGVRNNMADVNVKQAGIASVKNRECGNGVVLDHPAGFETQYCHLRAGSVIVKQGDKVKRGQKLGVVGLSGATEFPHVHFEVRRLGRVLDPFTAQPIGTRCNQPTTTLWDASTSAAFRYHPTALLGAGFAPAPLSADQARIAGTGRAEIARSAAAIVLWADIMGTRAGDTLSLTLVAPNGTEIATRAIPMPKHQAQYYGFIGAKAGEEGLVPGEYTGKIMLTRAGKPEAVIDETIKVNVPF